MPTVVANPVGGCGSGYTGGSICYNTQQSACWFAGETYQQYEVTCPAGTTEHGSFYCPPGSSASWSKVFCVAN